MKVSPIVTGLLMILTLALCACDDDSQQGYNPPPQHFAKHGKLLFSTDEVVSAIR